MVFVQDKYNDVVFHVDKFFHYIFKKIRSSIHNAPDTREWLALHPQLVTLDWPTKGADMNPKENIWGCIVCKLTKARTDERMPYHAGDDNNTNLFALFRKTPPHTHVCVICYIHAVCMRRPF